MQKRKKGSLYTTLLKMTLVPIVVLGIVLTILSYHTCSAALNRQVESELKNLSYVVLNTMESMYPGDYKTTGDTEKVIYKGEHVLNGDYDYFDHIKEDTGIDVSLFYEDTRVLTTVEDEDGVRCVSTVCNPLTVKEVLNGQSAKFYTDIDINGKQYQAFYMPVYNSNEVCVGMLALAKPAKMVNAARWQTILPMILISLSCILIVAMICTSYADKIVHVIHLLQDSMGRVVRGDLTEKTDFSVLNRNDEIGDMGRSVTQMQDALHELVEQDSLTHMYNRRKAEQKLQKIQEKALEKEESFTLVIGDIDNFKHINDTYGHGCGDRVLVKTAELLLDYMQTKGIAARWGGEEFLLVFRHYSYTTCRDFVQEIRQKIEDLEVEYEGEKVSVTMTFGMAEGIGSTDLNQLFILADDRLYQGKANGRNQVIG